MQLHLENRIIRYSFPSLKSMELRPVLFSILYTSLLITTTLSFKDGNETDRSALLAFKTEITQYPLGTLSSWNDSLHFCQWRGVTCGRKHRRVTILDLNSQMLAGSISPYIGNLTFLKRLDLSNNSFIGEIPQQVGRLFRLKYLALSNNSLGGEIPINVSQCFNLLSLYLDNNKLVGRIPVELGSLSNLRRLILGTNNLSRRIPSSLGNLSSLSYLYLRYNNLGGTIPDVLGQLTSLNKIELSSNNLSGMIPPSLYNLSLVSVFSMARNQLQGSLPSDIGLTLPNLNFFSMASNQLHGVIPTSFSNCSGLGALQLDENNFVGSVPNNFGKLENLYFLSLAINNLGSGDEADDDLNFLTSLTNCSNLRVLSLSGNNFEGMLPSSVGNLSTNLTNLLLGRNKLYGSIPEGIQDLVGLIRLGMEYNLFTGNIPTGLGRLKKLGELSLAGNKLTGQIPYSLGNLTQLNKLALVDNKLNGQIPYSLGNLTQLNKLGLGDNQLSGRIPSSLGNYRYLAILDLSNNLLNGTIPKQVIGLSSLSIYMDLGSNSLSGSLPLEVGNLMNIVGLGLYDNKLSGKIPGSLSKCISLRSLLLEGNLFEGNIPPSLSSLKGLEVLTLSRNNLTGLIPKDLEKLSFLERLNLSFNNLEGDVPREGVFKNFSGISIVGNSKLCGGIPQLHLPKCPNKEVFKKHKKSRSFKVIVLIVVGILLLMFIVSSTLILCWIRKSKRKPPAAFKFGNQSLEMVSYNEILKATDGFSSSNLLGVGSFGSVYKAIFHENEKPVAVKVLKLQQRGANKSFMAECDALRNVRHRNLLKIITSCSSIDFEGNDFKALIFELMPNGNLENWLHPSNADDQLPWRNLSFEQRLNIAIDVASALDYLHHHCGTPVVHCDLKPSNVLLDDDLIAHVSDFGLAKFLLQSSTDSVQNQQNSSAAIKGSIGYVAPEYGMGSEVSTRGDVYSYGILLLEMFTGKRPTADMFKDGISLHSFSKMALLSDQILEIVDARLFLEAGDDDDEATNATMENVRDTEKEKIRECLISMIQIGVFCSAELPADRMDMGNVVVELHAVKGVFLALEHTETGEIRHISR